MKRTMWIFILTLILLPQWAQAEGVATLHDKKNCQEGIANRLDPPYSDLMTVHYWKSETPNELTFFGYGSCGVPLTIRVPADWTRDRDQKVRYREAGMTMIRKQKGSGAGQGIVSGKETVVPAYLRWTTINPQEARLEYGLLPRNGESLLSRTDVDEIRFSPPAAGEIPAEAQWVFRAPINDGFRVELQDPRTGNCEGIRYEGIGTHGHRTSICLPANYRDFLYPEVEGSSFFESEVDIEFWNQATGTANGVSRSFTGRIRFYPDANGGGGRLLSYVTDVAGFPGMETAKNSFRKNIDLISIRAALTEVPGPTTRQGTMIFYQDQALRDEGGFVVYEYEDGVQKVRFEKLGAKISLPVELIPTRQDLVELKGVPVSMNQYDLTGAPTYSLDTRCDMQIRYYPIGTSGEPGLEFKYRITGPVAQSSVHEIRFDPALDQRVNRNEPITPKYQNPITGLEADPQTPGVPDFEPVKPRMADLILLETDTETNPLAPEAVGEPAPTKATEEENSGEITVPVPAAPNAQLGGSGCSLQATYGSGTSKTLLTNLGLIVMAGFLMLLPALKRPLRRVSAGRGVRG